MIDLDALERAITNVRIKSSGRTRFQDQEPYGDELLVAEIERLRALVKEAYLEGYGRGCVQPEKFPQYDDDAWNESSTKTALENG